MDNLPIINNSFGYDIFSFMKIYRGFNDKPAHDNKKIFFCYLINLIPKELKNIGDNLDNSQFG